MVKIEDLLKITKNVENSVCIEDGGVILRRYYRFRSSRNYGGSAVGDVIGCNLACVYCWCWSINSKLRIGVFKKPIDVVEKLLNIARENKFKIVRLSGGEPTLCINHLVDVLKIFIELRRLERFILETNGLLLGIYEDYVHMLKPFGSSIIVRVSIKGCTEEDFEKITGYDRNIFYLHIKAIDNLDREGIPYIIAIPVSFCSRKGFAKLIEILSNYIGENVFNFIEPEVLTLYPSIVQRLCKKGLKPWILYDPTTRRKISRGEVDKFFEKLCREQN
jgi:uncharacterized Fe-S cluster-containing radical SAM superfamily protein